MNSQVNEYELIREENIKRNNEQILLIFGSEPVLKASGIKRTRVPILNYSDTQADPPRRSHRISLAQTNDNTSICFDEVKRKYSVDSSGIMTCSACDDVVHIKSSNYDHCWRSHQTNCCNKNRGKKSINEISFSVVLEALELLVTLLLKMSMIVS
jgi:hypothetical protein